jgi:hypothetical protein
MERAAIHWTADEDAEGVILFSWGGTLAQKTKQNQNRTFVVVPRGGVRL